MSTLTQKIQSPTMPVDIFVQEANDLYVIAREDEQKLGALGLPVETINDLKTASDNLRQAESEWIAVYNDRQEAQKIWYERFPEGYDMRDDLLAYGRLAFRKHDEPLKKVRQIAKGNSHADMIQDLNDICALYERNTEILAAVNFDMDKLTLARNLSYSLADLLSESRASDSDLETKKNRDIAFTQCKLLIDEIRDFGKYAFRLDEDRLEKYTSAYLREIHKRAKARKLTEDANSGEDEAITAS